MTMTPRWSFRSVVAQLRFVWVLAVLALALPAAAFAQANPNQGPGGPILVVTSNSATFSKYYAEILRAEGLNEFTVADVATITSASSLTPYDVVVLGKVALTGTQVTALTTWVTNGGNLIAMDPDAQLASLLGLTISGTTLPNGYLAVDTSTKMGNGIVGASMQYHGSAHLHTLNGATRLATLYSNATTPTANTAVSLRSVGSNGGQAAAFAFDLATSIVYTRQGNPAWAAQERDGTTPIRSDDKFYGNAAGDPQPDWIDRTKVSIPQADEQQRFLANLILEMNSDRKPLPRFWYLPNGHRAAVVMTGDDHARAGTRARWNEFIAASTPGCNLDNWECIRGTSYMFPDTPMTNAELLAFEAQGFEVGLHINTQCNDFTESSLSQIYTDQLSAYHTAWPGLPVTRTMRHHCIVWSDWASGAKVQLANGIRLDTSYYYWPGPNWVNDTPGHFTGSAIPMRFADLDGTIIDVYQVVSQMTDESNQSYPFTPNTLLDRAIGPEEQYGVYTINAHTDADIIPESTTTVASAKARGVPVVTSRQMLTWLDGRNSSSFGSLAFNGTTGSLTFTVTAGTGSNGLRGMLPMRAGNRLLSTLARGTTDVSYEVQSVKGVEYAMFPATAGSYTANYVADTTPPVISARSPAAGATAVATSTNVSVTFNEAIDASTVSTSTVYLTTSTSVVVPATVTYSAATFTATIQPTNSLAAGSTYTVNVIGGGADPRVKDILGNALASTSTWTFTTNAGPACPCSGWTTETPIQASAADSGSVELGVKFRSNVSGVITGLRFYKSAENVGTHIGNIWDGATGLNLGSATFINESASGWQTVMFGTPINVTANATYVASYFAPNGHYAADGGYFEAGKTTGPLYFPSSSESGGNGVFAYASNSTYPNGTWNSTNYWVDVIFTAAGGPADPTPPVVTITGPTGAATFTASSGTLVLSGTASDNVGVTQVTWTNSRGGSGSATGTASWSTSAIPLQIGSNVLTVTAMDAAGNLSADTITVSFTSDTAAPTITSRTPAAGATGVSVNTNVQVVFSEAMDPSSITASTVELRTASSALVTASVSYNASTLTATISPSTSLNASATYTVNVKGGATAPQVKDLVGNALASTSTWTFTTSASVCPCSIWDPAAVPVIAAETDSTAVEVGVKFRSDVNGSLTGIRFFKGSTNTGTHTAHLWSTAGDLIASAAFINETASGWQQANFDAPVPITANTTYIASYHAPEGHYAADAAYFSNSSTIRGVLRALQNGIDGENGVYKYGAPGTFPDQSWNSTNYWVDVVFSTTGVVDNTPPTITTRSPGAGATGVTLSSPITATFSEALDASTVSGSTFELRTAGNVLVPATVTFNASTRVATLVPTSSLTASSVYNVTIRGGATDPRIKDAAGNALAANATWSFTTGTSTGPCGINAITAENCLTGNLSSEWDVAGAGDSSIQGYATQISVNRGSTIQFKVDTDATNYRLDIYRMGYYGGRGARKITTVNPTATLPQVQDPCVVQSSSGLIDCGSWNVSASWPVPATAVSGIYFAKLVRPDTGGSSHIVFIVRDDASTSKMVFQTSDTTWQAYNNYGGNSLYQGSPGTNPGRAYKVSYNRPFNTRAVDGGQDWVFNSEYPMVRWLEQNGYDVSYISGVDTDRAGSLLQNHRIFLSVGHDEYWSGQQRANVEAARNAGVNLAFFSGNEVFWKTRWENSIDSSNTPYRTLVSYKETHAGGKIDPTTTWTGTWRDGRFSTDGGKPENALTGTAFEVNNGTRAITIPAAHGKLRFWRNTSVASLGTGQTATLPEGTLGYEWDEAPDDASSPPGLLRLSSTVATGVDILQDLGSTYGLGTATHALTLYKHSSGALVFGAGTIQWAWGLDDVHDRAGTPSDIRMRQATVNLFADMGVQPNTLQADLFPADASTDTTAPTATITAPAAGSTAALNSPLTISGTATDAGGEVGAVQVSVDGGTTWRTAVVTRTGVGTATWTYSWTPTAQGTASIVARGVDDSATRGANSTAVTVAVGGSAPANCPCTLFSASDAPASPTDNDTQSVVTGMKFSSNVAGTVSAIRFYKGPQNTGTHTGTLWTAAGAQLASVVFSGETASGWQQMNLSSPVTIQPNVTYVVAYHSPNGHYPGSDNYFSGSSIVSGPLTAPASEDVAGGNGVYKYGSASVFPDETYQGENYWVDVVFNTSGGGGDTTPPTVAFTSPTTGATFATGAATMALSGTSSDNVGVTQVSWVNNRGGSGNATGTGTWSVSSIGLQTGTNVITVTARDAATNVGTKVLTVTYTPAPDGTAPTVTITTPTSSTSHSTNSATLNLGGTASDNVGVTLVEWTNSLGGSGTATGTASWTANGIALTVGLNAITVTARDAAGNVNTDLLNVTYSLAPDTTLPNITITTPTSNSSTNVGSANTITLGGTASDNVGVTQVTWSSSIDPVSVVGVATGTTTWSAANIPLINGGQTITVTARDAAGNVRSDTIAVTSSTPADGTNPTITITTPTSSSSTSTTSSTITLGGTASDNRAIKRVEWTNSRGGSGTATGTTSWSAAGIVLQPGSNLLTVRAFDLSNRQSTDTITVTFNAPANFGLVAAYSFNEGTGANVADASGNNNLGTVNDGSWTTSGRSGSALVFNGTSTRVFVNSSTSLNLTAGMTLMAWVQPNNANQSGNRTIIRRESNGYWLYAGRSGFNGTLRPGGGVILGTSTQETVSTSTQMPNNTWRHVAITYDGTEVVLYVNGAEVDSEAATGTINSSGNNPLWIGGNSPAGEYFQGVIDEVRVYNRALSATEVNTIRDVPITP
jgi:hypothetical protein